MPFQMGDLVLGFKLLALSSYRSTVGKLKTKGSETGTKTAIHPMHGITDVPVDRGIVNTYGVYQEYYETAFLSSRTSSDLSWIGTFQGFLLYLIGILTGPTFDCCHFRTLISVGTVLVVFGMMMTSLGKSYSQIFLAQSVVVGLGAGCLFIPSIAICATYFSTRRALATGIAASGGSVGMALNMPFSVLSTMRLTRGRWRHLPHPLPPAPLLPWLRLGDTCHCSNRTSHIGFQPRRDENAAPTSQAIPRPA